MTFPQMTPLFELLGWILVHSVWQFAAIALIAAGVDRLTKNRNPSLRYSLLMIALSGFVVAVTVTGFATWSARQSESGTELAVRGERTGAETAPANGAPILGPNPNQAMPVADAKLDIDSAPGDSVVATRVGRTWSSQIGQTVRPWFKPLVALWLVGVCAFSFRPICGLWTIRTLCRVGVSPVTHAVQSSVARLAMRVGVRRLLRVLQSSLVQTPVVVGWLRPTILLPVSLLSGISAVQLDAILAHEIAHVCRHDYVINLFQAVLETLFFYHPAVWWLTRRIRDVRELCCDDLAVGALGNRVEYGRALLFVEESRVATPHLALGARGGSILERIERLFQSSQREPICGVGGFSIVVCVLTLLGIGLAGAVSTAEDREPRARVTTVVQETEIPGDAVAVPEKPVPAAEPEAGDEKARPAQAEPIVNRGIESMNIVIAKNVIVWDRQVVTWDEVVDRLRAQRKKLGAPIHPNLYFTNGAHAEKLWKKYHDASMQMYRELFEPVGISFGSISPRASERYDQYTEQSDLDPNPELLRHGVVRDPQGELVVGATVVLFPEEATMPIVLREDLSLRDTLDEIWTTTDREGRFRIESPASGYRLAVISSAGFTLASVPEVGEEIEIELPPLARVDLAGVAGAKQKVGLSIHFPGLPNDAAYFQIYDFELKVKPRAMPLPAGAITVSRSFDRGQGSSVSVPAETINLVPGERKSVTITQKTLEEVFPEGLRFLERKPE
ncbi:MAG: M56 family metallopeptidase [Planctomycetota bacterium]|nr:M56 family metallopeptidase [Planctomycetota bacterium]